MTCHWLIENHRI